MKKTIYYVTIFTIITSTVLSSSNYVNADEIGNVKKELSGLEQEQRNLNKKQGSLGNKKENTEQKINENLENQEQVNSELNRINSELESTQNQLQVKTAEIQESNEKIEQITKEIEQIKTSIKDLKERIAKRDELLKDRLRALQQSGGNISYIELLMGAKSFGEFLNRATAVTKIMNQDKGIMETHMKEKKELENKRAESIDKQDELEVKKKSLKQQKQELEEIKSSLDQKMEEKETLLDGLEGEQQQLEEYKISLEEQQQVLRDQEAIIEKAMKEAKKERKKLEQLAKDRAKSSDSSGSSNSSSSSPTQYSNLSANGSGIFSWPAAGRFTSGYGSRSLGYHLGIDIANGEGTPIKAAASGYVTRSAFSSSYGNVVYVFHPQYNKTTLYAHMESRAVNLGEQVSEGQPIGGMGNTGNSFGNHLHFEVHNGGWSYKGGINPMQFLK